MNYDLKGTNLPVTPELRSYVEKCLAHADKFLVGDPTAYAAIELQYSPLNDNGKYRAECTVSAAGEMYRAESWGSGMHEAIDLATGELIGELSQRKKKRLALLRRTAVKVKEYLRGWRRKV